MIKEQYEWTEENARDVISIAYFSDGGQSDTIDFENPKYAANAVNVTLAMLAVSKPTDDNDYAEKCRNRVLKTALEVMSAARYLGISFNEPVFPKDGTPLIHVVPAAISPLEIG